MISYIIKSALCLAVLLFAYRAVLENQKMHRFNRYFLLLSIIAGLVIPLITTHETATPLQHLALDNFIGKPVDALDHLPVTFVNERSAETPGINLFLVIVQIYSAGALTLSARFINNLRKILSTARRHQQLKIDGSVLVLLDRETLPHTFLQYIFLNKQEYNSKTFDNQLLIHEMAHVRQKHSLDILLIEALQIIFWFNPVFVFYKRAIRLNHEFLADEAVLAHFNDIASYQQLLLDRILFTQPVTLSSNLTYSLTKKRMIMMKKTTPRSKAITRTIAMAPLLALLVFLFSGKATALPGILPGVAHILKKRADDTATVPKVVYYKDATVKYKNKNGVFIVKKYEDMTAEEKASMPPPSPLPAKTPPTEAQLTEWKSSAKYGIWVNDKHITNEQLANYKASDFCFYWNSRLTKKAQRYGIRRFQIDLLTPAYYKQVYIDPRSISGKKIVVYTTSKGHFAIPVPRFESNERGLFENIK